MLILQFINSFLIKDLTSNKYLKHGPSQTFELIESNKGYLIKSNTKYLNLRNDEAVFNNKKKEWFIILDGDKYQIVSENKHLEFDISKKRFKFRNGIKGDGFKIVGEDKKVIKPFKEEKDY